MFLYQSRVEIKRRNQRMAVSGRHTISDGFEKGRRLCRAAFENGLKPPEIVESGGRISCIFGWKTVGSVSENPCSYFDHPPHPTRSGCCVFPLLKRHPPALLRVNERDRTFCKSIRGVRYGTLPPSFKRFNTMQASRIAV